MLIKPKYIEIKKKFGLWDYIYFTDLSSIRKVFGLYYEVNRISYHLVYDRYFPYKSGYRKEIYDTLHFSNKKSAEEYVKNNEN